jgi:hypothetical protein
MPPGDLILLINRYLRANIDPFLHKTLLNWLYLQLLLIVELKGLNKLLYGVDHHHLRVVLLTLLLIGTEVIAGDLSQNLGIGPFSNTHLEAPHKSEELLVVYAQAQHFSQPHVIEQSPIMVTFLDDLADLLDEYPGHLLMKLILGEGLPHHMVMGAPFIISF